MHFARSAQFGSWAERRSNLKYGVVQKGEEVQEAGEIASNSKRTLTLKDATVSSLESLSDVES